MLIEAQKYYSAKQTTAVLEKLNVDLSAAFPIFTKDGFWEMNHSETLLWYKAHSHEWCLDHALSLVEDNNDSADIVKELAASNPPLQEEEVPPKNHISVWQKYNYISDFSDTGSDQGVI